MSDVPVKAVKKALDLLSLLAFRDPAGVGLTLTGLAGALGLPVTTTHNLLKTMTVCGYAAQNGAGRYIAGPQCRSLGILNRVESERFRHQVRGVMNRYTAALNEALVFAVLRDGRRVVLARTEPAGQIIRIDPKEDAAISLYRMPTGRVLAALASPEERSKIVAHYGEPGAAWPAHEADRERIRKSGACIMLADSQGVHAFAAAVRDSRGTLLGAIGCHAPAFRCDRASQKTIRDGLCAAASELADA